MSFDLTEARLVWIEVKWKGMRSEGEGLAAPVDYEIELYVELVDRDRLAELFIPDTLTDEEILELARQGTAAMTGRLLAKEQATFKALVHDWRKVLEGGKSVPMTPKRVARLLKVPNFGDAFHEDYMAAWKGQVKEREKNFGGSPENGRAAEPGAAGTAKASSSAIAADSE